MAPSQQVSTCANATCAFTLLPCHLAWELVLTHTHLNITAHSSVGSAVFPRRGKMLCFSLNSLFSPYARFALLRACCSLDQAVGSMGSGVLLVAWMGWSYLIWWPYAWIKAEFGALNICSGCLWVGAGSRAPLGGEGRAVLGWAWPLPQGTDCLRKSFLAHGWSWLRPN